MLTEAKERLRLSKKARESAKQMADQLGEIDRRIRERKPEAPDGSGEKGKYNERLSKLLGGRAVYETESGTAFFYNGIDDAKVIEEEYLERARSYIEKVDDNSQNSSNGS